MHINELNVFSFFSLETEQQTRHINGSWGSINKLVEPQAEVHVKSLLIFAQQCASASLIPAGPPIPACN